jgi:polyphenol oxidase
VFYRDQGGIYRVAELDALPWLVHGFGTRLTNIPSLYPQLGTVKQIHSASCFEAAGRTGVLGEADALLEDTPGAVVAVKTADCVPILLADNRHRAVAAVHAGWRGTVAGIVGRAVEAMHARFGTDPADLDAAIGPAIGACCYEVGPEVSAHFGIPGRAHVDLADANRGQLAAAGLAPGRIHVAGLCTLCHTEFHSFRRDREASGRMHSFAGIRLAGRQLTH